MRTLRTRLVLSLLATGFVLLLAPLVGGADNKADDKPGDDAKPAADAKRAADAKPLKEEGFIGQWLVIGPIKLAEESANHEEQTQKPMLDKEYFKGQKNATPKAGDKASVDGADMEWKAAETDGPNADLEKFANDAGKDPLHALFMGTAYIVAAKEMPDVKLSIGSDDSSVWWVNGKEVIRVYSGRPLENDQDKSEPITLKQGPNVIKFAVINGEGPVGVSAHFMDKDDKPITDGLKVTLMPPAKGSKAPPGEAVPAKATEEKAKEEKAPKAKED